MNKIIYFLRTAPYNYQLDNYDIYDSFDLVASREANVSIIHPVINFIRPQLWSEIKNIKTIFCSPIKRSKQTAKLVGENYKTIPELYEVKYSMKQFITKKDFYKHDKLNVTNARESFVKSLMEDNLTESYSEVIKRVEKLLLLINEVKEEKVLVFSHGFFLKIIEAYIRDESISNDPQKLLLYFDGKHETFKFGEGFVVTKEKKYTFSRYVRNKKESN